MYLRNSSDLTVFEPNGPTMGCTFRGQGLSCTKDKVWGIQFQAAQDS